MKFNYLKFCYFTVARFFFTYGFLMQNLLQANSLETFSLPIAFFIHDHKSHFLVFQAQFDLLYNAAVLYMENNDTYINFPL